jgi:hypothetical protein
MARFYLIVVESFRFASRSVGQLGGEGPGIGTRIGARIGQGWALSIVILDSFWKIEDRRRRGEVMWENTSYWAMFAMSYSRCDPVHAVRFNVLRQISGSPVDLALSDKRMSNMTALP